MSVHAFILLPVRDDAIIEIGDTSESLKKFIDEMQSLFDKIREDEDNQLFYDEVNMKDFIEKFKTLLDEKDIIEIEGLRKRLRAVVSKQSINITDDKKSLTDVHYILWNLNEFKPDYAPAILAEIAERMFQRPDEKYLLLNIADALEADRKVFLVFKDALHKPGLPEKFAHIPYVKDLPELELWLATHQIKSFSLLDKNIFRRTSEVQQGKPVFEEIATGRYWYLDNFHKNEYEVFNSERKHIGVANLEGMLDESKKKKNRTF